MAPYAYGFQAVNNYNSNKSELKIS